MRAACYVGDGRLSVLDVEVSEPATGDVQIDRSVHIPSDVLITHVEPFEGGASAFVALESGDDRNVFMTATFAGYRRALDVVCAAAARVNDEYASQERDQIPLSELIVGLECGGADTGSGVTAIIPRLWSSL